jgi:UDP-glucose 4-epimerase
MRALVTGAAGFIGSHLCEYLLKSGYSVVGIDNLKRGSMKNLSKCVDFNAFDFKLGDVCKIDFLSSAMTKCDFVYHLADESDIQFALMHPESYFKDNMSALYSVLSAMKANDVRKLFYPSSTTVFGSKAPIPTPESYGPLHPESLYGASKVAAEAFLFAWGHAHAVDILIFRFAAIIGGRQDHGVIHDFTKRLCLNPSGLHVFGNGSQLRSFVLIDDCVEIIYKFFSSEFARGFQIVHLGNPNVISIREVAEIVASQYGLPLERVTFEAKDLGWVGDSRSNQIDIATLGALNFIPRRDSREAVAIAASRLKEQHLSAQLNRIPGQ